MDGDEQRRRSAAVSSGSSKRRTVSASSGSRRQSGKEGGSSSSGSRSRRNEAAEHIAALLASASASCKKADIKGILVRPSSDQAEMGSSRNGKSRGTSTSTDDNEAAAYHNNPVLAPLLKLLPKHVDPSTLKTLLKGVHPSAFGSFKTKEAWRKENPDVLSNSFDSNSRAESCPAGCRGSSDDDETCSYSYSPTGSLSSLADLEEEVSNIYDDTPSTSVSPIPPLPSSSSSSISPPRYTSAYLSTPQDLSLRRYRSNSSIASACTCTSASSRTSSIRFAPLPEEELQSRERKPQLSYAMGIAGRAKMLQGRKAPQELSEDSVDEIFDPELRQIDAEFDEEEDPERRSSDITLRYNEDGDIVEKRPLGVTLEELVFPVKKHRQQERGRSRATSDLSASFQRRSSSTEPLRNISPSQTTTSSPNKTQSPSSSSSSPISRHASEDSSGYADPTPMQTLRFVDLSLEQTPIPTPRSTSPSIPHHSHHSLGFTPISSPPKGASAPSPANESTEEAEAEGDPSPELDPCDSSSPSGSSPESPSSDSSDFEDEEAENKSAEKLVSGDIPLPQLLMAQNQLRKMQNNAHSARKIKVSRPLSASRSAVAKKRT